MEFYKQKQSIGNSVLVSKSEKLHETVILSDNRLGFPLAKINQRVHLRIVQAA
jgi:hypothetical protein